MGSITWKTLIVSSFLFGLVASPVSIEGLHMAVAGPSRILVSGLAQAFGVAAVVVILASVVGYGFRGPSGLNGKAAAVACLIFAAAGWFAN